MDFFIDLLFKTLILMVAVIFILYIIILFHKKKGVPISKLIIKQSKGFMLNWMKNHVNNIGKKMISVLNILLFIFFSFLLIQFIFLILKA